jgi:predicted SnoaL-like aldol condensation-catalyzing enzyme
VPVPANSTQPRGYVAFRNDCSPKVSSEPRLTEGILVSVPPFQQMLGVPEAPDGIFEERAGTDFDAPCAGSPITREESRAVGRRLYDGAITTGVASHVDALAEDYIQNTGWTPDGRSRFGKAWAIGHGAMPDGLAVQNPRGGREGSSRVDQRVGGTATASGQSVDFASADFLRIENGVAAEHWDTVDYVRLHQAFGLLPPNI